MYADGCGLESSTMVEMQDGMTMIISNPHITDHCVTGTPQTPLSPQSPSQKALSTSAEATTETNSLESGLHLEDGSAEVEGSSSTDSPPNNNLG